MRIIYICFGSHGIVDEQWQSSFGCADHEHLSGMQLNFVLCARLNSSWRLSHIALNINDALLCDASI